MGVTSDEFVRRYPRLYHMAEAGSWPSIARHGLLSTSALLDLFEIRGLEREAIESRHRPQSVRITHPVHGVAVIRDQKPLSDARLSTCLTGCSVREWYELLNKKAFLWTTEDRLKILRGAEAYRSQRQCILVVDSASLLRKYARELALSPMNSGATRPFARPRGPHTFQPMAEYPYEARRRHGKNAIVEVTVERAIPDIRDFVLLVEEVGGAAPAVTLLDAR